MIYSKAQTPAMAAFRLLSHGILNNPEDRKKKDGDWLYFETNILINVLTLYYYTN